MTSQAHRGRKALLARAAHYPGITDSERLTLIKLGAPNIPEEIALDLIEKAQQLGSEFRHEEADDIIGRLANGEIGG